MSTYVEPYDVDPVPGPTFEDDINALPGLIDIDVEDFDDETAYPVGTRVSEILYEDVLAHTDFQHQYAG